MRQLSEKLLTRDQYSNLATSLILTYYVSGTIFSRTCTSWSANLSGYGPGSGLFIDHFNENNINDYPTPELSNTPLIQSQCNYMATNLSLTSNLSGTTFAQECTPSSTNVTGYIVGVGTRINDFHLRHFL